VYKGKGVRKNIMEEEAKKEETEEEQVPETPLDKMTAKELRVIAREIPGITGVHAMKKEDLLSVVKKHRGTEDKEPPKEQKKKTGKPTLSVRELKKKIAQLREEKKTVRDAGDRKKVDILRRRVNRLKKQTRKVSHA
jgi:hypothetical protein